MAWFYSAGGEQKGPVEAGEFEALIAAGTIRPETLVWQPGMPNWQPASDARPDLLPPMLPGVPSVPAPMYASETPALIGGRRYGGFWIRFLARFIDGLILMIPSIVVIVLVVGTSFFESIFSGDISSIMQTAPLFLVAGLINAAMYAAYDSFSTSTYGGTPGKLVLGLRVILLDGSMLNLQQALIRHLIFAAGSIIGAVIPFAALWYCADNIPAAFDLEKRALHDRIVKTLVVKK
jgi:uncharacterized RDD family membrane protein YckC